MADPKSYFETIKKPFTTLFGFNSKPEDKDNYKKSYPFFDSLSLGPYVSALFIQAINPFLKEGESLSKWRLYFIGLLDGENASSLKRPALLKLISPISLLNPFNYLEAAVGTATTMFYLTAGKLTTLVFPHREELDTTPKKISDKVGLGLIRGISFVTNLVTAITTPIVKLPKAFSDLGRGLQSLGKALFSKKEPRDTNVNITKDEARASLLGKDSTTNAAKTLSQGNLQEAKKSIKERKSASPAPQAVSDVSQKSETAVRDISPNNNTSTSQPKINQ